MRSSGTPFDRRTSTAISADPPVPSLSILADLQICSGYLRTCCQHRIQQQNPPIPNILRQLIVKQPRLARLLIPLNQNLAYPDASAALSQCLLHCFARTHDRDAADFALEFDAGICAAYGCCYSVGEDGKVVESFLDQEAVDAVAVEDEVGAGRVFVADHSVG